ncbi:MAG: TetR/AcrR family transcriptional regulator, partial [Gammaproteobacteria bacterium]|nr:TetR/AcrR family transcriptional regulator [Gammaproteobacteria bacterium]
AIRNWAQSTGKLKRIIEQSDRERIAAIHTMFSSFGYDREQAETRALTVYYTQVGYISMMVDEPLLQRISKMPAYVAIYSGQPPTQSEISRFLARHELQMQR